MQTKGSAMWGQRVGVALRGWLLVAADATVLVTGRHEPGRVVAGLAAPRHWLAAVGSDAATAQLAAGVLWVVALWLAIGLLAGCARALPGRVGRTCDAAARTLLPAVLYRLVAGTAGLGVVLAPALAIGADAVAAPAATVSASTVSASTVSASTVSASTVSASTVSAGTVSAGTVSAVSAPIAPAWPTDAPLPAPAWPTDTPAPGPDSRDHRVVVRPGDSLWRIAAEHLPAHASEARVAQEWPRWFAANHRVIGPDPDHITPGQVLQPPKEQPS